MADNKPLLSICLPTNGAVQFVTKALDSIYAQEDVDKTKYEVFITDNGQDSQLEASLEPYMKYGNLRYLKTNDKGFLNLITCLKLGNGLFCKMLNHRSVLIPGSLQAWIDMVDQYKDTQPVIYCTDHNLKGDDVIFCHNFNSFIRTMSYWSSWSAGIGVWDKDKQILDKIECNEMFPNASLLFEMRQDGEYVIWNKKYQDMEDEPTKGGYNIFHTFAVIYLDLLKDLENRGRIRTETFNVVRKDLLHFLSIWYYRIYLRKNSFTFDTSNFKEHMLVYYTKAEFFMCKLMAWQTNIGRVKSFLTKKINIH